MIQRAESLLWKWAAKRTDIHGIWPSQSRTGRIWREGPDGACIRGVVGEKLPNYKIDHHSPQIEYLYEQMGKLWKDIIEYRYLDPMRDSRKAARKCNIGKTKYFSELDKIHKHLIFFTDTLYSDK